METQTTLHKYWCFTVKLLLLYGKSRVLGSIRLKHVPYEVNTDSVVGA